MADKSFMKIVNRIGPKTDHCRTPKGTNRSDDVLSLILTNWAQKLSIL